MQATVGLEDIPRSSRLDEPKRRLRVQIVFLVGHPGPSGDELHSAAPERLRRAHAVLVREAPVHDVRADLRVAVRVGAEATGGLDLRGGEIAEPAGV